jgi:ABC-2 type transport system ATP-binding protein
MSNIVEIEDLTKDYETGFWRKKKVRALDGLSISVEAGQIFGFLGGNGAGKTTTIKILMGLLFPTAGRARILGRDISHVAMHSEIGYCPENPYFYDHLTARELMSYFGELFGFDAETRNQKTDKLLTAVGLEPASWDKQLRKFSKGMLQRVGLAQALINDPKLVFLDEPMSGLDPIGRREIRELIAGLRERGTTVFMSTHILSDIEALCDEVAILRGGKLAAKGKLNELLTNAGEELGFEVTATVDETALRRALASLNGSARIVPKPSGVIIGVDHESEVDKVLAGVRQAGGRLISVEPVKQSLEELFVEKTV